VNHIDPLGLKSKSQADEEFKKTKIYKGYEKRLEAYKKRRDLDGYKQAQRDLEKNRKAFYKRLGKDGYTIYSDDFSRIIQHSTRSKAAGGARESTLIVAGGNSKDWTLFDRNTKDEVAYYESMGYDVNLIKVTPADYYSRGTGGRRKLAHAKRNIAKMVKSAMGNISNLQLIQFYSHMGSDINLTNYDADITP